MKIFQLSLVLIFSITSTAQDKSAYTTVPDLVIIKSKLVSIYRVDVTPPDPPPEKHRYTDFNSNPPMYKWRGRTELEVQNTGKKSIKSVYWEFFLTTKSTSEMVTEAYRIHSRKIIRPGQTVKITAWFEEPNLNNLREHFKRGLLQGHAEIKRVDYAGGHIWMPLRTPPKRPK